MVISLLTLNGSYDKVTKYLFESTVSFGKMKTLLDKVLQYDIIILLLTNAEVAQW